MLRTSLPRLVLQFVVGERAALTVVELIRACTRLLVSPGIQKSEFDWIGAREFGMVVTAENCRSVGWFSMSHMRSANTAKLFLCSVGTARQFALDDWNHQDDSYWSVA